MKREESKASKKQESNEQKYETQVHTILPVYDKNSKILIMGSFPSVKSRENNFFYGHPQNRFWKVTASLFGEEVPAAVEQKKAFLLRNHIALWDVIAQCDIIGSSDSSIRNVIPNDIMQILNQSQVSALFVNGKKAKSLYDKYILPDTGVEAICLPSTSPANAACSFDQLLKDWSIILPQ